MQTLSLQPAVTARPMGGLAAERLFGVLHPAQQRVAVRALPLSCLPRLQARLIG